MTAEDYKQAKQLGYVPYLRPLGFKKSSSDVLGEIKKHTDIPLIGKLANARQTLSDDAFWLLEKDIFAADLYEQVLAQKNRTIPRNEYTREIVLLYDSDCFDHFCDQLFELSGYSVCCLLHFFVIQLLF